MMQNGQNSMMQNGQNSMMQNGQNSMMQNGQNSMMLNGQNSMMQNGQNGGGDHACCMVPMPNEELQVLTNFIEDELSDQRYYQAFARQAPGWARKPLMDFSNTEGTHARRLMGVYFLITGSCYTPSVSCEKIWIGPWCSALRERYHAEACGGQNYIRAAQSTNDPCLSKLFMASVRYAPSFETGKSG